MIARGGEAVPPRDRQDVYFPKRRLRYLGENLGCDFFERRGEKHIDVGTLLAFLFFSFSDGVLCFRHIFCVFFLALVHLQVRVCAYGRIDRTISGT